MKKKKFINKKKSNTNNIKECIICYNPDPKQILCINCKYLYCDDCAKKIEYSCSICKRNNDRNNEDFNDDRLFIRTYILSITVCLLMIFVNLIVFIVFINFIYTYNTIFTHIT